MAEIFMPHLTHKERVSVMQETAFKIEDTKYTKFLTAEEKDIKREEHTDLSIKAGDLKEEAKEAAATFKAQIDPLVKKAATILTELRTGQTTVEGTLYHMPNYESGMMETYEENGELVSSRRLRPEERQGGMLYIQRDAKAV